MPTIVSTAFVEEALRGILPISRASLRSAVTSQGVSFIVPGDAGRKVALARLLVSALGASEVVVAYECWEVWPSSEMMGMFLRIRGSEGVSASLAEADAELVPPSESEYLECVVACALFFSWDFALISPSTQLLVFASNDEVLTAFGYPESLRLLLGYLDEFEMERV